MIYSRLTADQVTSTYTLFRVLERLRVSGHMEAHTEKTSYGLDTVGEWDIIDMTGADYCIIKDRYSSDKVYINVVEEFEKLFGRFRDQQLRGTD